jgi:eukaryotic-like serine/threonine-protein kinase
MITESDAVVLLAARLADRYALQRELGRGGMATVYLARDLRHGRLVALKFLRPELSSVLGAERFEREIAIAARLSHPHILPLLDSGALEGGGLGTILYYAMPYVEGRSLRERMSAEPQLPIEEAVGLAGQVAQALEHAHHQGIVHRDIKPENILLSDGQAVVADFGIARALDVAGAERLTETGLAMGTPAYMSPEQSSASARLDGRSDLYSLGCVLYEMLAGQPPFSGPSPQAVLARHAVDPVPPLRSVRPTVSRALEQVIERALAKVPADRYATAAELATALEGALSAPHDGVMVTTVRRGSRRKRLLWGGVAAIVATVAGVLALGRWQHRRPPVAVDPNVVAVFPFRVTAPDSGYNYLREGIVDLLNAKLTGDGGLRAVDSRTTLSRWRRAVAAEGGELPMVSALAVARDLGAGQLFLGEFVRTPSRMTVNGRLLRVPDGKLVAEHAAEARPGEDELALVGRWLGAVLARTAGEDLARLPQLSDSTAAVKSYLAGMRAARRGEQEAAAAHYKRALEIDSTFALAAYRLRWVSETSAETSIEADRKTWSLRDRLNARDRASLVGEFGPNYPKPYTMAELIRAKERAVDANPDSPEALAGLGGNLLYHGAGASIEGWLPRAVKALDSAINLDSTFSRWDRMYAALVGRHPEEIRRFGSLYLTAEPTGTFSDIARWVVAHSLGDSASLAEVRGRFDRLSGWTVMGIIGISALAGLPLSEVDRAVSASAAGPTATPDMRCVRFGHLMMIGAVRGQVGRAMTQADSANMTPDCGHRMSIITLALADPGYRGPMDRYAQELTTPEKDAGPEQLCYAELWHVSRGDTTHTRRAVERIRRLVRKLDPGAYPRVGRRDICPSLLEAAVETMRRGSAAPMLARLDSLMQQGTGIELPGELANLLLARRLEARGDLTGALAAVRRRSYGWAYPFWMLLPAYLREEGRLAAVTGDTAGAIRAYHDYLTLRDRPDPGPMQEEVSRVKAHLAELVGEKGRR